MSKGGDKTKAEAKDAADREARLAKALRENLRRRKEQVKVRDASKARPDKTPRQQDGQ